MGCMFRWAGSKERIKEEVLARIGSHKRRSWVAPFCGALHVELAAMEAQLADVFILNDACIGVYSVINLLLNGDFDLLVNDLRHIERLSEGEQRLLFEEQKPTFAPQYIYQNARRLLILQACAFNGLYRGSSRKEHNVPFGKVASFDFEALEHARRVLRATRVEVHCSDFEPIVLRARAGDVVYADPGYINTHSQYGPKKFTVEDHLRLSACLMLAKEDGAECWVSGSDCDATRDIYRGAVHVIEANRSISCKGKTRGKKPELLIHL